jgi:hypothetical protein
MEFGCSVCEYTSEQKRHVIRHINKNKSCGNGIKEIIEIPIDIICEYCNKEFSIKETLKVHIKNYCKYKDVIKDAKITKLQNELKVEKRKNIINKKQIIRTEARKLYKKTYKILKCVHCKNSNENNIQICHIKPVKDFNQLDIHDVNNLSNLISLCANCHLDYDKGQKFKVCRTVIIHTFIIKHLQFYNS